MYICKNCGKEFKEKYSKYSDGNFCCKECARSYSQKYSQKTKIRKCIDCGIDVEVNCHVSDHYVRCKECAYKHLRERKNNSYHKRKDIKASLEKNHCLNCNKEIPLNNKYCSAKCQQQYIHELKMKEVEEKNGVGCDFRRIKEYLILHRGHKCEICGIKEWNGLPVSLILDHINGRASDDRLENLRLICPNCDAQLPTYKSKNKNSDRKKRKGVWK